MSNAAEGAADGADLDALREKIDALKEVPVDDLVTPPPASILEDADDADDAEEEVREHLLPEPEPTDAIGSEEWGDEG
jgi:hypothetical protein